MLMEEQNLVVRLILATERVRSPGRPRVVVAAERGF